MARKPPTALPGLMRPDVEGGEDTASTAWFPRPYPVLGNSAIEEGGTDSGDCLLRVCPVLEKSHGRGSTVSLSWQALGRLAMEDRVQASHGRKVPTFQALLHRACAACQKPAMEEGTQVAPSNLTGICTALGRPAVEKEATAYIAWNLRSWTALLRPVIEGGEASISWLPMACPVWGGKLQKMGHTYLGWQALRKLAVEEGHSCHGTQW